MTRTSLSTALLAVSLLAPPGCGSPEAASEAIDESIRTATENVEDAAGGVAYTAGEAAAELGDLVKDTAEEVGKAIDNRGREKSNAK